MYRLRENFLSIYTSCKEVYDEAQGRGQMLLIMAQCGQLERMGNEALLLRGTLVFVTYGEWNSDKGRALPWTQCSFQKEK